MSFCTIKRNSEGKITRVNKPDGSESNLFTRIAKHPLIKDTETAAELFKNKFSEKFKKEKSVKKGNRLFNKPLKEAGVIADQYANSIGMEREKFSGVKTLDKNRATVIAAEFERMDNSNSELTQRAYSQMAEETIAQFEFIMNKGYTIEVNNSEPYSSSSDMIQDLRDNKNMKIFSTESGFGDTEITEQQREENPLLQKTEFVDKNGVPLLINDLFRFVHDFFGHAELGNGFGPIGEENAWNVHVRMYSPLAARAMTTETRGQNSWVNFSGVNDKAFAMRDQARKLRKEGRNEEADALVGKVYEEMSFAEQKIGLLPEWVSDPNGSPQFNDSEFRELEPKSQAALLGYTEDKNGSKIAKDGKFLYGKGIQLSVDEVVDRSLMTPEEIQLLDTWKGKINMYGNRGGITGGIASFNGDTKVISIHLNNPIGPIIFSNQREVNRAVLHEIIHAYINENVSEKDSFNKELIEIVNKLKENKDKANPFVQRVIGFIEKGAPEEVLTYMLTTKSLADFMANIESDKSKADTETISLWDRLLASIKRILDKFSLLDEAVNILNKYTETIESSSQVKVDIDNFKSLPKEESSGNTYEVNKEVFKKGGIILPVVSINTTQEELSEELVDEFIKENKAIIVGNDLKLGIYKFPNSNVVSIDLNIITPESKKNIALPIAKALKQESIYNLSTGELITTGESGENVRNLSNKEIFDINQALLDNNLDSVADLLGIEPELVHKVGDTYTNSFKEALILSKEGETIEVGFYINEEFTPLLLTRKNTNKNTEQGYINNLIMSGLLDESKVKVNLDYTYQAAGETELSKSMNAMLIQEDAAAYLGGEGVKKDGFTFTLEKTRGKVRVMGNSGEVLVIDKSELDSMTYEEIKQRFDNHIEIITQREWEATKTAYREVAPVVSKSNPIKSEEELQLRLLNLLNKLGVKVMSINEYVKKYKLKHGVNPSAKALADIANQVVAYTKGDVMSLSEEAAHFINEAFPREQVENILRNIHKTKEYAEFNKQYRAIYAKEYKGDALEDAVRREVLGKIVAKVINKNVNPETETQKNIFDKIFDIIDELFAKLSRVFKQEYSDELNQYLNEVEEMLSAEDISDYVNLNNFKDNRLRLYNVGQGNSAVDKLRKKAGLLAYKLQDTEKKMLASGSGSKSNVKDLDKVQRDLEDNLTVQSILSLVSMVNANVKALNAAIKDSKDKNKPYFLSDEENVVYQTVKHVSGNAISEVKALLNQIKKEEGTKKWDNILKEIDTTILNIQQLNAEANLIDSQNVQRLVNRIMEENNIEEENRDLVTKWIEKAEADTNLFHSTFGQLVHAKDGLLNLAGQIIKDMHNETQVLYYNATKDFQAVLKSLGVSESDIGKLFVDGQYIVSEYDFNAFNKEMDTIYVETYRQIVKDILEDDSVEDSRKKLMEKFSTMSNEELIKAKENKELEVLTLEEETNRKNLERPRVTPLIERTMVDSYYEEYEEKLREANISDVTKQELSNYLSDISTLKKKAFRKEGNETILDFNSLSESDKIRLSELHKRRKMLKSFTDESGELKPGLGYSRVNGEIELNPETNQPVVKVIDSSKLTEASIIALDINKLDSQFSNSKQKQDAGLFYSTLDKIFNEEGREAALKFLEANAYTNLSQEFWNNLGTKSNTITKLERLKKQKPELSTEIDDLIYDLKIGTFKIKNIIKLHNRKNNPSEVEVELMSTTAKDSVKQLQRLMKEDIRRARKLLGELEVEEGEESSEDGFLSGVSEVNESYRKELRDLDLYENEMDSDSEALRKVNEELDFAKEHMTNEDANLVESNRISIEQFLTGSRAGVNKSVERVLENLGYDVMDLNQPKVRAQVLRSIVRGRVLPYYKRYTSEAYTEFMQGLETTNNISDYLQNSQQAKNAFIEITPNPTFFDSSENENLNPNYNKEFKGGYLQPKLSKFKNSKFEELFGTISKDGVSSKNNKLYQAYLATLEYNEAALNAMNVGETYNKYLLPQIRKQQIQRFASLTKDNVRQDVRNFVKDALTYTEDDLVQGEQMYGQDVKVIPKMYINKLENPEDVSNDLFFSLALRAKEAYGRQSKVKYYGDLMSIYDKIASREMNGKDPKSSNTYKMMKSAIDYNLFGVKETVTYPVKTPLGTVDLTKMARMLLGFVKFRNLGLNLVIPITSMLTGEVTRKIETAVGEFIDSRSQKLGAKEYRRIAMDGMKEIGELNTEAKLNALGQFFKAFDLSESFNNSNYSKFLRFLPRTAMALHTAANYPLYGKTMLGVLHDFRVVEGKMMNKKDFLKIKSKEGLSKKDAKAEWDKHESSVMYSYLKHEGNKITWNREALKNDLKKEGRELTEEELDEAIKEMFSKTQRYISLVNSLIDGQIPEEDRVLAQRHYLLSYFMTHRGWLSIGIARRFKNRHLNLDTNLVEEGSYRSLYGYMGSLLKEWREGNFYNFLGAFKETWNKSDELTRRNMRRVAIESGILSTLMVVSLALRAAADDEENKDFFALQLSNYLTYRTLNELSSVQFNIGTNMFEAVESPFVGMNTIKNLYDIGELFSGEEVKHGSYRGMSKRQRYLTKMVPGMKQYFDLQNMNQTYDTYKFYNTKNFSLTPANVLWANTVDKRD